MFNRKQTFKETFKIKSEEYEEYESFLEGLDPMIALYAGCLAAFLASLIFFTCKKPRGILIQKFLKFKTQMVWNGLITFLEGCFVNYCILLVFSIQS